MDPSRGDSEAMMRIMAFIEGLQEGMTSSDLSSKTITGCGWRTDGEKRERAGRGTIRKLRAVPGRERPGRQRRQTRGRTSVGRSWDEREGGVGPGGASTGRTEV